MRRSLQRRSSSEERFLKIDAAIHTKKGEMKEILSDHYEIVEAYDGRMALDIIDRESIPCYTFGHQQIILFKILQIVIDGCKHWGHNFH